MHSTQLKISCLAALGIREHGQRYFKDNLFQQLCPGNEIVKVDVWGLCRKWNDLYIKTSISTNHPPDINQSEDELDDLALWEPIFQSADQYQSFQDHYTKTLTQSSLFWKCINVRFYECFSSTDRSLKAIDMVAHCCRFITVLDLSSNYLADEGAHRITLSGFKFITSLNLQYTRLTDKGAFYLSQADWKHLKELGLDNNFKICSKGLRHLIRAKSWNRLECLFISSIGITDDTLKLLVKCSWPKLRMIRVCLVGAGSQILKTLGRWAFESGIVVDYASKGFVYGGLQAKLKKNIRFREGLLIQDIDSEYIEYWSSWNNKAIREILSVSRLLQAEAQLQ